MSQQEIVKQELVSLKPGQFWARFGVDCLLEAAKTIGPYPGLTPDQSWRVEAAAKALKNGLVEVGDPNGWGGGFEGVTRDGDTPIALIRSDIHWPDRFESPQGPGTAAMNGPSVPVSPAIKVRPDEIKVRQELVLNGVWPGSDDRDPSRDWDAAMDLLKMQVASNCKLSLLCHGALWTVTAMPSVVEDNDVKFVLGDHRECWFSTPMMAVCAAALGDNGLQRPLVLIGRAVRGGENGS